MDQEGRLRTVIVDDDEMMRVSLSMYCDKIEDLEICGIFDNAMDAMNFLKKEEVDLLFLDVEMPSFTGVELVQTLEDLPWIIFITSKKEYAADAFEFKDKVVDYITKPVAFSRLVEGVEKARAATRPEETDASQLRDYLFVRSEGKLVRINLGDLLYIETVGDYLLFKTTEGQHIVYSTLKSMDEKLRHPELLKVHRSYIVNLSKIVDIEDNTILIGKKVIPVSRAHRATLWKKLNPL